MNYCTEQDLIDAHGETELIQLTDRSAGLGVVNSVVLNAALDKADALINQRLRSKGWTLPLTLTSEDLKSMAMDITRFYLHQHMNEVPKQIQDGFSFAIKTLGEYVRGLVELDIGHPPSQVNNQSGAGDVDFSAPARVFTDDSLRGF